MPTAKCRGIVRGDSIVLLDPPFALSEGSQVWVSPIEPSRYDRAAIKEALESGPKLTQEDIDEWERVMAEVESEPARAIAPAGRTPAAIPAAMAEEPDLTDEDVDELERAIVAGKRPPSPVTLFDDEMDESGDD